MNDLIEIEETTILAAFVAPAGLDPLIQQAKDLVDGFEHNVDSAGGRARTASLAAKVAKFKTRLDSMGKGLTADWKAKSKVVDNSRKEMRDTLDLLKIEARQPLTEWESAELEKEAAAEAERVQAQINNEHELAILLNEKIDMERAAQAQVDKEQAACALKAEAEAAAKVEADRLIREKQIADDARVAAEQKAAEETERHIQSVKLAEAARIKSEADAKAQAEESERQRVRAAEQSIIDQKAAVDRAEAKAKAEQVKAEADAAAAQEKLEANKKHVGAIRKAAKESLMEIVDEATAKKIVLAISNKLIANVTITY